MTRPSARRALADARELAGHEPASPSSASTTEAVAYAKEHGAQALPATLPTSTLADDGIEPFYVVPVAVAVDRTGGHAAMREDFLLPLDVTDDAASRLAHKLCQETGMHAPSSAQEIKEQVLEYLAPFREELKAEATTTTTSADAPPRPPPQRFSFPRPRSSKPKIVEVRLDALCDGVRVEDRLLWDLSDPAPQTAAWSAETARDLGLSAEGCAALRTELEAALAAAREREGIGGGGGGEGKSGGVPSDVSAWRPRVGEEDRGGWQS